MSKTAINQAIDICLKKIEEYRDSGMYLTQQPYRNMLNELNALLPAERSQIEAAAKWGLSRYTTSQEGGVGTADFVVDSMAYYEETFGGGKV